VTLTPPRRLGHAIYMHTSNNVFFLRLDSGWEKSDLRCCWRLLGRQLGPFITQDYFALFRP
jgi:hypothetical protein